MTEQELAVADSYFVIDMPVSLSSSEVVIGARSTLCFRGGTLVNDSTGTITLKGVLLPVCNSTEFWDDGQYLSTFLWEEVDETDIRILSNTLNLRPRRIIYHGTNVECFVDYDLTYIAQTQRLYVAGEWQEGDIIRRIGTVNGESHGWVFNGASWEEI